MDLELRKERTNHMRPLASLRILDLTNGNPYPGSLFADYGAEVWKIEPPGRGDPIRRRGGAGADADGPYQSYYNRNKKSVTLDITQPAGQEVLRRLAASCDMLVANTPEARLAQLGLGFEQLRARNAKLVYGVLTPFGEAGPWKDLPDYDLLIMARTGLLEKTGLPDKPTRIGCPLSYYYGAWHLTAGMMAAWLDAQDSGEGRKVSVSCWQAICSIDDTYVQGLQGLNVLPRRIGNGFPTTNPTDTFQCKNGWFALSIGSDAQWLAFAAGAGRDDWGEGTVYAHDPDRSMKHYFGELDGQLRDYFRSITIEEADRICREAMVPGGPCNTVRELMDDEQVAARHMLLEVEDPVLGKVTQLGKPAKFLRDAEGDDAVDPAPALGAHTDRVLAGLGMAEQEISDLRRRSAI